MAMIFPSHIIKEIKIGKEFLAKYARRYSRFRQVVCQNIHASVLMSIARIMFFWASWLLPPINLSGLSVEPDYTAWVVVKPIKGVLTIDYYLFRTAQ